jgi:carboxymethylenebutenolidase
MGGGLAVAAGMASGRVGAIVDFYGVDREVAADAPNRDASVLAIFAGDDAYIPTEAVAGMVADLEAAGVSATIRTVAGVRHGFMNDSRPEAYDAVAAAVGWSALLAFFRAELA